MADKLLAKMLIVVSAFEMITLPRTYRFARPGEVPIPRFEETTSVPVFMEVVLIATV